MKHVSATIVFLVYHIFIDILYLITSPVSSMRVDVDCNSVHYSPRPESSPCHIPSIGNYRFSRNVVLHKIFF